MEYRRLGGTGLKVSELCLGCMTFGRETDEKTAGKILFSPLAENSPENFFRCARGVNICGVEKISADFNESIATKVRFNANIFLGKTVAPNQIGLSRGHIMSEVEASLRRLKMDYIDLYQVHSWDFETPIDETMRALDDLVRHGKVRYIGASNFTAWQLMKSLWVSDKHDFARFDCLQPQYSLISREIEREILPLCRYEGVGVIPWSPLGGGFLTGKYRSGQRPPEDSRLAKMDMWNRLADERNYSTLEAVEHVAKERGRPISQVALAWVNQQPGVSSVIYGARTEEQNEQNLGAIGFRLEAAELAALNKASALPAEYPDAMQARLPGYQRQ
ncbi:aldo/keto reductase [Candidatus Binatus sp.]|uniref:aldo/keto reductase n=1 Tax=Candidatus Binatus sp. TaxID=2811406 RepID=UPI003C696344